MQQNIRMRGGEDSDSDTEPLYYMNRPRQLTLDRLRSICVASPGFIVAFITVAILFTIIGLVFKLGGSPFPTTDVNSVVLANISCGMLYGTCSTGVCYFKIPSQTQSLELSDSLSQQENGGDEAGEEMEKTVSSKTQLLDHSDAASPASSPTLKDNHHSRSKKQLVRGKRLRNILVLMCLLITVATVVTVCLIFFVFQGCRVRMQKNHALVLKGIPYALPPIDELRWQPPQPLPDPPCWGEQVNTFLATKFPTPCTQYDKDAMKVIGSEDCLYLNVWTPQFGLQSQLPVMVFFHGGGLMTGSGNEPDFSPSAELAGKTNTVYVSFNYRLNAFGYMSLVALAGDDGIAGNYGLLDQIAALQWVKDNIADLGGNPDKVTVFGSGSGATSIYALLASEKARGLFHQAWLASPSPLLDNSSLLATAQQQHQPFIHEIGCSTSSDQRQCLLSKSAEEVIEALDWTSWSNPHYHDIPHPNETSTILLTVGGHGLKQCPIDAWRRRVFNEVPVLIGNTAQEVDIDPFPSDVSSWNWTTYDDYIISKFAEFEPEGLGRGLADDIISHYPHEVTPEYQLTSIVSDIRYILPLTAATQVVAIVSHSPVYRYVSTFRHANTLHSTKKNYAYQGIDMQAFLGSLSNSSDPALQEYNNIIRETVMTFAKEGKLAKWNPHSTLIISDKLVPQDSMYKQEEFHMWNMKGFIPDFASRN